MQFTTPNSGGLPDTDFAEIGWTDAARAASAIARRGRALVTRKKGPAEIDLWPHHRRSPYRTFVNGKMTRHHGAPVNFSRAFGR